MNYAQLKQYLFNNLWYGGNSRKENVGEYSRIFSFERTVVMPDESKAWGIDISHWNLPPVDLKRMKDLYGMSFVVIKGCDGSLNTKHFPEHVQAAKDAGIPYGMYVWLYPNNKVSISAQVNAWVTLAKQYDLFGVFIDAEWTNYGGLPANPGAIDLRDAHDKFKSAYLKSATTYTAKGYADTYLKGFDFTREENWVAAWGVSVPSWPASWTWHQFTNQLDGRYLDPNGNLGIDGNYFNGTKSEFTQRYLGGEIEPPPEPPPTGGDVIYRGTVIASNGLNVRNEPSATATKLFAMPNGTKIEADLVQNKWWHIVKINNTAVSGANWSYEGESQGYIRTDEVVNDPPPPPAELPDYFIAHDKNGNELARYNKA